MLLINILLALIWGALTGSLSASNLLVGFLLGYMVLFVVRDALNSPLYSMKVNKAVKFLFFFLWELLLANLKIAYDVLTPTHHMRPGVVAVPLDGHTDAEIAMLANTVTLTPGTMSLDVSTDRKTMYIHAMYMEDEVEFRRKIKDDFERRILEILR